MTDIQILLDSKADYMHWRGLLVLSWKRSTKKDFIAGTVDLGVNTSLTEDQSDHFLSIEETLKIDILSKLKSKHALPLMQKTRVVEMICTLDENLGVSLMIFIKQAEKILANVR